MSQGRHRHDVKQGIGMALCLGLFACHKPQIPTGPSLAPSHNVHLRTSFDTDPSPYLGRFLPEGLAELDESSGMTLACSAHVSWRFVDGGGVETVEMLHASSGTRARLGVAGLAEGAVGSGHQQAVRVAYKLTGKMVSTIDDPAAFAACCKAQPDQCTDRIVGEFMQGTGSVELEVARGRERRVEAIVRSAKLGGEVRVADGVAWRRAAVFPEPVYFAFKATPTPYAHRTVRTCADWATPVPEAEDGLYLRATSAPVWSEKRGRQRARANLAEQALSAAGIDASPGVAVPALHEQDWCMEQFEQDGVTLFAAHVLGFLRHEDRLAARASLDPVPASGSSQEPERARPPLQAPIPVGAPSAACATWVDTLPVADDGIYVVGRNALPALTKHGARIKARANAHLQAGLATGLGSVALANSTSIGVQERDWCITPAAVGRRTLYHARLLGFVSREEQDRLRALPLPAGATGVPPVPMRAD